MEEQKEVVADVSKKTDENAAKVRVSSPLLAVASGLGVSDLHFEPRLVS